MRSWLHRIDDVRPGGCHDDLILVEDDAGAVTDFCAVGEGLFQVDAIVDEAHSVAVIVDRQHTLVWVIGRFHRHRV